MGPHTVQYLEGKISKLKKEYTCVKCGGRLEFTPGSSSLKCPFCGELNPIVNSGKDISEQDYESIIKELEEKELRIEKNESECRSCGSVFSIEPDTLSTECPFCATPLVIHEKLNRLIKPKGIHPFRITAGEAKQKFAAWIKKRWFLPSEMKKRTFPEQKLTGIYLPYWTYDADSISYYSGERGIVKHRTESYTAFENGRNVTKQRVVSHTEWNPVSGVISHAFDDVLIPAGKAIPDRFAELIKPWKLMDLSPFNEDYLAGFRAETYSIGVREGFGKAREKMDSEIRELIRKDIGGDKQKIGSVNSSFDKISFKHILLPLWMSSFRYNDKVYRFVVNGVTGEVQGTRPWSKWKILRFLLILALIIAAIVILT